LGSLATTVKKLGRYHEAEEMEKEVLEWRRRVLGVDHPYNLLAMSNLGWTISHSGRHAEAVPLQRQALEMRTRILGADHPITCQSQRNL
ncbi:hypothetical protein BDV98DRAFT_468877, partial [Pterulicium gracile]